MGGSGFRPNCCLGVEKAIKIVQSPDYFDAQARRLLLPLLTEDDKWQLLGIDFGVAA